MYKCRWTRVPSAFIDFSKYRHEEWYAEHDITNSFVVTLLWKGTLMRYIHVMYWEGEYSEENEDGYYTFKRLRKETGKKT